MTIDWITILQEQADFATRIAEDVNQTLKLPDLTPSQAARLYRVVEEGAQTFDVLSMRWNNTTWKPA
ncbi:hypothetical protein [Phyllobacterium lublinensis]|uniref:hypothetical protein n=1 Tax=Phyllobacterium lublinensis TaxID=2875708 RepID=UPI001CCE1E3F|nr:hypothetical protein [Phyllobacterium sp. 2063]MBZ9657290.1 hypothetical protein [Phyllobacterium sp. 2063]